jgi:predicted anti-sigma-YlaC factor YlaD
MQVRPEVCDRARGYASRGLDGDLGELEVRLLESHLERCVSCQEFAVAISAQTNWLRTAEPEAVPHAVEVPRRRFTGATLRRRAAVAAVAAAAAVGSLQAIDVMRTHSPVPHSRGPAATSTVNVDREFWSARGANMTNKQMEPVLRRQIAALPE